MKTLVIPDVHQRIYAVRRILCDENDYDEVVFLGDWFDSFLEPPDIQGMEESAEYLRHLAFDHHNKDKFVFLVGNHDLCYIFNNNGPSARHVSKTIKYYCSGFTATKARKFRKAFFDRGIKDDFFIERFKLAHRSQNWTFSHAGIIPQHFPYGYNIDQLVNELLPDVWRNFRNLEYTHNWLVSGAGISRGGCHAVGGVTWCDWNMEFNASDMVGKQVCGHTHVREPSCEAINTDYESWNLDTEKDYGIIIDGRMTTKPIPAADSRRGLNKRAIEILAHDTLRWD